MLTPFAKRSPPHDWLTKRTGGKQARKAGPYAGECQHTLIYMVRSVNERTRDAASNSPTDSAVVRATVHESKAAVAGAVVALVALVFTAYQTSQQAAAERAQENTQKSQLEVHLQERMTALDTYFATHPALRPYFYTNSGVPPAGVPRARVLATGEMVVDIAATVGAGMQRMDAARQDQWRSIMHAYWCQSPAVRRTWSEWADAYTPATADALGISGQPAVAEGHFEWQIAGVGREGCAK